MLNYKKASVALLKRKIKPLLFVISVIVVLSCILGSFILFTRIWEGNADTWSQQTSTEVEFLDTGRIYHMKTTLIVEYYFPLTMIQTIPSITKINYTWTVANNGLIFVRATASENITNNLDSLRNENITIESIEGTTTYGETEVRPPEKATNYGRFPFFSTYPMAKSTVTIKWSYETTQSDDMPPSTKYELRYNKVDEHGFDWITPQVDNFFNPIVRIFPAQSRVLVAPITYDLILVLFGFVLCVILLRNKLDFKEAHKYLIKGEIEKPEDLCKKLKILT
jgi:hypothetical protein